MHKILTLLLTISVVCGDRALVKIGVSKTTIASITETTTTSTTTPSTTSTEATTTTLKIPTSTSTSKDNTTTTTSSTTSTTLMPPGNATDVPDAKNETANATEVVKIPRRIRLQQEDNYYCKCDLKINVCDIDCCCDIDCTEEMLQLFDCHETYVSTQDYHVLHGLPSCKVSSSIFCVLKNNLHRYDYEEFDETLAERAIHHWPETIEEIPVTDKEFYRLHDPIGIWENGQKGVLGIPLSLSGGTCHVEESIKFLRDTESICLQYNSSMDYITKLTAVEIPPRPEVSCSASNSCLAVELFHCKSKQCSLSNVTELRNFSFDLMLRFTHNFTHLVQVEAFMGEKKFPGDLQRFDVRFVTINESHSHTVSGNIGYQQGKPVIFSHIHSVNISEEKQQPLIDYFHPNRTTDDEDYHMEVPMSYGGICSNSSRETINFGENQMRTCDIHLLDPFNVTQDKNFTELCHTFHKKILQYLLIFRNATDEIFVSEFGNPRNDTSNWIQVDFRRFPENVKIEGIFDDDTITCRNMIIRVKHVYQFGRLEVFGNRHQALIERASMDFGPQVDLQFRINEEFRVPIIHVITFMDLTHRARSSASQHLLPFLLICMSLCIKFILIE